MKGDSASDRLEIQPGSKVMLLPGRKVYLRFMGHGTRPQLQIIFPGINVSWADGGAAGETIGAVVKLPEPAPAGGATVTLKVVPGPTFAATVNPTVHVDAGSDQASFAIATSPSVDRESTFHIEATYNGVTKSEPFTIHPR